MKIMKKMGKSWGIGNNTAETRIKDYFCYNGWEEERYTFKRKWYSKALEESE
ncbi:hypothetical protein ABEO79_00185 [Micromonospora provocatoris]